MSLELAITFFVIAAFVGAVVSYFVFAVPARTRAAELEIEKAGVVALADRVPQLDQTIAGLREDLESVNKQHVAAQTALETERKSHEVRVEELRKMGDEIEQKFTVLASEALGKNSRNFLDLMSERFKTHKVTADNDLQERQKAIETLIQPISESLAKFEHRVGEIEKAREGAYHAITEQVKNLVEGQTGLRSETSRLVQALQRPKTRGRWGEYQLRNVLEMAGMTKHVDFIEEQTIQGDDGGLRPDVIVRLPGGKSIIVDAKTPLEAYLAAIEAGDEAARETYMVNHARHVREHVRLLGSKDYWKSLRDTPDFVVMFIPGEAIFAAAFESDPTLFEQAVRKKVLISTPTTFIALVKAIAYGWQQEKLAENAQQVANLARDLYERIKKFGEHMGKLGDSLKKSVEQYNESVGSLERRILPAARKFETLGVTTDGSLIPELESIELEPRAMRADELIAPSVADEKERNRAELT